MHELRAGLQETLSGRGRLFLVTGEPGIGKTRLADEVAREANDSGARILWGRCWERGGAPPYWPWLQVIRACTRELSTETLTPLLGPGAPYLAKIIPEVRERLPELPVSETEETEEARFRLFDAATSFLIEVSAGQPLGIFLDDLHAADVPSLLLLEFLARELRQGSILVLGAYRELEARQRARVGDILVEAAREGRRIPLGGLSEAEVGQFVSEAKGAPAQEDIVSEVHHATEGNPLFVGEIARLLTSEAALPGRHEARTPVPIPETLRQAIRRRLEPLSRPARQAITVASATISEEFQASPIQRVSELVPEDVLRALGECVAAGILEEVPGLPGGFTFSHGVVRETIYDDLPVAERLHLHRAFGTALEEQYRKDADANVAEIAYHFFQAAPLGEVDKAIDYAVQAAELAGAQYAWENAASQYERALRALVLREPADQRRRTGLLLSLGHAQNRADDVSAARETFLRAAEAARTMEAPEILAAAALGYGRHTQMIGVSDHVLVGLLEEALAELGSEESPLRVDVMTRLAIELVYSEDAERRERLSREAVELARKLEDPEALSYAIEAGLQATAGPDNAPQRLAAGAEILLLAGQTGNRERRQVAYIYRLPALLEMGGVASFDQEIEAYFRVASELRDPAHLWFATVHRVIRALLAGRFAEGEQLARDALDLGERGRSEEASQYHAMQRFTVLREQGRLDELDELEPTFRGFAQRYPTLPFYRAALALLHVELGREAEARVEFEQLAQDGFAELPRNLSWIGTMALVAEVCASLRDEKRAAELYDLLVPYGEHNVVVDWGIVSLGSASRFLGLLAYTLGRLDDAERHLQQAIEANTAMGAMPHVAHAQRDQAAALLSRDARGDRDRALELLYAALGTAERLEMKGLGGSVTSVLAELGAAPDAAAAPPVERLAGPPNLFRREGEYWSIAFEGESSRLKDSKGLRYLARLLAKPGSEVLALELITGGVGQATRTPAPGARERAEAGLQVSDLGDAGEMLDAKAKEAYRRRVEDLREELEEAESFNDPERAAKAREEMDFLARELSAAVGLGGRDRKAASAAERARVNATRAIRAAIERITEHCPPLGKHLEATIRTGMFCSYNPDPRMPAAWRF